MVNNLFCDCELSNDLFGFCVGRRRKKILWEGQREGKRQTGT